MGSALRLTLVLIKDLIEQFHITNSPSVSFGFNITTILRKHIEAISRF